MIKLSVNINKVATLRNARGGNIPNVLQVALDCERFGADGITVHPRPDQRHVRYSDVVALAPALATEFNIEGNPTPDFIDLVKKVKPAQVTLVPDAPNAITSNAGWDTLKFKDFLKEVIAEFKKENIRTSIFIDPKEEMIEHAAETGVDRIELYTEAYACEYYNDREKAIYPYVLVAKLANEKGLGINAGHDLNADNLHYFASNIPGLLEVSIGHALISDALYFGLENVIQMYKRQLMIE
jgi:pyridoxine 5-phosphate synthase